MNILFVASCNDRSSGAFLSLVKLCVLLRDKHRCNVNVVLPHTGSGTELIEEADIPYYIVYSYNWTVPIGKTMTWKFFIRKTFQNIVNAIAVRKIKKIITSTDTDIVHINTTKTYVGAKAALSSGIPYVWHLREFLEEDQGQEIWKKEKGYQLMNKAAYIIAISDSIREKYLRYLDENKLVTIYNGIDLDKFYIKDRDLFSNSTVNLLMVGRVSKSKGQWQALNACALLIDKGITNFKITFVGGGDDGYIKTLKEQYSGGGYFRQYKLCWL